MEPLRKKNVQIWRRLSNGVKKSVLFEQKLSTCWGESQHDLQAEAGGNGGGPRRFSMRILPHAPGASRRQVPHRAHCSKLPWWANRIDEPGACLPEL